ncbi:hypothetical protein ACJMK2_017853 [Sinanodonta woodiana]|uniref:BCL-6 corepressor n=1 Tax=Sinanodonta woodiana TaxID=1069815 RepID=A0ABD3UFG7_SINWO
MSRIRNMYNRLKSEHGIARIGGSTWPQLQCGDRSNKKHTMEQNTVLRHSLTDEGQPISVQRHSLTEEDQLCQVPSIFQNGVGGKAPCTPPLDLSGLGSDVQKRETDSPLDLSLKTRKRCADSTDEYGDPRFHQLVMQPMHGMPPPIKRVCTYPVSQQQNGKELVRQQPQSITGWDKVPTSSASGGRHGSTSSVYRSLPVSQSHITNNVSTLGSKELSTPSAGNGSRIHSHIGGHGPRCETMCEGHSPGATGYKRVLNPELIPRQACQNLMPIKQVKEQSTSLDPMTVQQQGTTHMRQDIRYPSHTVNQTSQMTRTYNQTSRSQYLENRQRISNYTPGHLNSSNTSIRSERNPIHAMEKQVISHESRPYLTKQSELSSSHSVRSDQRSVISQQISASSSIHTEGQRNMASQQKMACLSVNESSYAPKPKSFPSNQLYAINPFSDDVNDRMYIEQNAQTHVRPRQVKDTNVRYESNYGAAQSIFSGATHRCSPDSTNGMLRKESVSTISQYPEEHKLMSETNIDPRNISGLSSRLVDAQRESGNGRQSSQNQLGRQMNFIGSFIPQSGPRHDVTKQLSPLVGASKSPLPSNGSIKHPAISTVPAPKDNTRMNRTLSDSSSVPQVPKLIPNKPRDKPSLNRPIENTRTDMKADRDAVAKSILQTFSTIPLGPNFCTNVGASGRSITKGTSGAIKPEQRSKMETLDSYITRAFQELDESERRESKRTVSILEAIQSSESKTDVSEKSENRSVGNKKETGVILANDKKDEEKIKSEGTVMTNFSTLLSIAIPSSVSASSSFPECSMNKPGGSIPNPKHYSKKHKILNAVKQDEDLKEMVETNLDRKPTIPPPPPPSSVDILKRIERQIPSGGKDIETDYLSCPASPKMPILSPQENQATPSTVSPAIREPPTLEPPTSSSQTCILDSLGKHFSRLITDAVKGVGVFAEKSEKDPNIFLAESCLVGQETDPQPDLDVKDKTASFSSGTFPSKTFLSRQNSVTKNIPIANVAPIVHGKMVEHQLKENADSKVNGPEIIKRSEVSNAMFAQHMLEDQSKITRNVWTSFTYHGIPKESFKISHPFSSEKEFSKGSGSTLSPGASDGKEFTRTPVIKKKMLLNKHSHEKRCPTDNDIHSEKDSMDLSIYEFKKDNYSVNDKHIVEQSSYQHILKNVSVRSSHEYKISIGTRRDEDSLFQSSSSKGLLKTKAKNTNRSQRHVEVKTLREKSACPRPKASSIRQKADKLRRRARQQNLQKQVPGKRKSFGARLRRRNSKNNRGFVDFQPEVLRTRTRNQTAGRQRLKSNCLRRLNSSSTSPSRRLSRELYRSPRGGSNSRERKQIYNRNKNASRKRDYSSSASRSRDRAPSVGETEASPFLSQDSKKVIVDLPHSNRSQRTSDLNEIERNRNSDNKIFLDKERKDELEGRWEIKGATSTLKQTLRSGKSKGGLMLKIYRRAHDDDSLYDEDTEVEEDCSDRTTSRVSDADDEEADEVVHIQKEKKVAATAKKKSRFHFKQKYIFQKKRRHRKLIGPNKFALNSKKILQIGIPQQDEERDNLDDEDAGSMESGFESIHLPRLAINKDSGETLLHRAARLGYEEIALKCLASGSVDVNARDNAGYTPLHECCARGDLVIARHLLNHGADVNCCSQDGIRPIHDAVETDQVETVRMLLSYGADPCISTYAGKTPLKLAKSERMRALITGYLGDLNGFECESETQTWEFGTSSKYLDPDEDLGQDVFSDMPSDPEDESEDMLDVSSKPQFLVFHIASDAGKRTDDFLLLSQILEAHGLRRNDLDHIGLPPLMIKRIDREKFIESQKDSLHIESYTSRTREQSQFEIVRRVEATLLFAQMEKLVRQNSIPKSSLPSSSNLPKKVVSSFFKYDTQASPSTVDDQDQFFKDVRTVDTDGSRSQVTSSKRHSLPALPKFKFGKRASEGSIGKRANEGEHKNDKHDRKSYVLKCKSLSANNSKRSDQHGESELKLKIGKLPKKQFDAFEFEDDDSDTLNNNEGDEMDRVPCQSKSDS